MSSRSRKVAKVKLTTAELRQAATAITPFAVSVAEHVIKTAVSRAQDGTCGPRRRRGQRLTAFEQLAIFFYAVAVDRRPREIGRVLGMEHRTVRRFLASKRFERFTGAVDAEIARTFSLRRHFIRARSFLVASL